MGNYKFRFSDMIPNAWFHKLKDMSKPRSNFPKTLSPSKKKLHSSSSSSSSSLPHINHTSEFTNHSDQRKSYYFTRDLTLQPDSPLKPALHEPPRKSSQRRRRSTNRNQPRPPPPPRLVSSSIASGCSCRTTVESVWVKPQECSNSGRDSGPDQSSSSEPDSVLTEYGSDRGSGPDSSMVSWSSPCKCGTNNDIIIDIDNGRLAPIITKRNEPPPPTKIQRTSAEFSETNAYGSLSVKVVKEDFVAAASPVRRLPAKSPGMKLRVNSPKIANRRIQGRRSVSSNSSSAASRRSISDSFAVVKASKDPSRDFRESMVEMILENNIRASNDLEELLACYLSLNSDQYHDLIINVFKQIWFDFIHLRLN